MEKLEWGKSDFEKGKYEWRGNTTRLPWSSLVMVDANQMGFAVGDNAVWITSIKRHVR